MAREITFRQTKDGSIERVESVMTPVTLDTYDADIAAQKASITAIEQAIAVLQEEQNRLREVLTSGQ